MGQLAAMSDDKSRKDLLGEATPSPALDAACSACPPYGLSNACSHMRIIMCTHNSPGPDRGTCCYLLTEVRLSAAQTLQG